MPAPAAALLAAALAASAPGGPPSTSLEIHPQRGHTGWIEAVALSADGRLALTGSSDRTARLWDLSTGLELRAFTGHTDKVLSVALSPDGRVALTGGRDGLVFAWDVTTGRKLKTFVSEEAEDKPLTYKGITGLAVSPDGQLVAATSGAFGTLQVWRFDTGAQVDHGSGTVRAFLDGQTMLLTGASPTVRRLGVQEPLVSFAGPIGPQALSGDGRTLVSCDIGKLRAWDVATGAVRGDFADGRRTGLQTIRAAFTSPDGALAFCAGDEGPMEHPEIQVWDVPAGRLVRTLTGREVFAAAVTADGRRVFSGAFATPAFWDAQTGEAAQEFPGGLAPVVAVAVTPDGKRALTTDLDHGARVWDLESGKLERSLTDHPWGEVYALAVSPDGRLAATADAEKGTTFVWEIATGRKLWTAKAGLGVARLAFTPDGARLIAESREVQVWDVKSGKRQRSFRGRAHEELHALALSPDGRTLALGGFCTGGSEANEPATPERDACAHLYDLASGKLLRHLDYYDASPVAHALAWSPGGDQLLLAGHSGLFAPQLLLFDGATGKRLRAFAGHDGVVRAVAFSPDGRRALSGSDDASVRLWEVASGAELRRLDGHTGPVRAVAFTPDGRFAVSGSEDGSTRVWNLETGKAMTLLARGGRTWAQLGEGGFFDASPDGAGLVALIDGTRAFGLEQLAFPFNRPDLVLGEVGLGTPALLEHYRAQFQRRLRKAGLTEEQLAVAPELPQARIAEVRRLPGGAEAEVDWSASDARGLKSWQLAINGAPLFAGAGRPLAVPSAGGTERVPLTAGLNRIEVSALGQSGQESLRALAEVRGEAAAQPSLYFLGFGVSSYADPEIQPLGFAHKDALDLAAAFAAGTGWASVHVKTFTDAEVTAAAVAGARALLSGAQAQDAVVLFVAGHGLHDQDPAATWYFVTHDTRLADLAGSAASFELIEGLLDGIAPRQKLFLLDSCESGELDPGGAVPSGGGPKPLLAARALRPIRPAGAAAALPAAAGPGPRERRPWLLARDRFIYQDLSRRTGAVVFSSSGGGEWSFESRSLQHGLFTDALLKALSGPADEDRDGRVSAEELRRFVARAVESASGGRQHPTVDRDNLAARISFPVLRGR